MDVIVIGKRSHNRSDKPEVIYCGQSRDEAKAAVAATNGAFPFLYYINPEPFQRIETPAPSATPAPKAEPESEPEPIESETEAESGTEESKPARHRRTRHHK
jgi:hypothetical protein